MLRISRLTDYGIVVMTHLAVCGHDSTQNARELASSSKLPAPVVSKLLNHVEGGSTKVYDRYSYAAEKCRALAAWGGYLDSVVSGRPAPSNVVEMTAAVS